MAESSRPAKVDQRPPHQTARKCSADGARALGRPRLNPTSASAAVSTICDGCEIGIALPSVFNVAHVAADSPSGAGEKDPSMAADDRVRPLLAGLCAGSGQAAQTTLRGCVILAEPSVPRWRSEPDPVTVIEDNLRGGDSSIFPVAEIDGQIAGGTRYEEKNHPDVSACGHRYLPRQPPPGPRRSKRGGRAAGQVHVRERGQHRITIDPAAANRQAIRSHTEVGFRPVEVMRQYKRGSDGYFPTGR
jgi:aminoglycoside 6'-N-acetyltransferase